MAQHQERIEAFSHYDSAVFLGWLEAIGDMMLNGGECASKETAQHLGGMIMALSMAAQELQGRERESRS